MYTGLNAPKFETMTDRPTDEGKVWDASASKKPLNPSISIFSSLSKNKSEVRGKKSSVGRTTMLWQEQMKASWICLDDSFISSVEFVIFVCLIENIFEGRAIMHKQFFP